MSTGSPQCAHCPYLAALPEARRAAIQEAQISERAVMQAKFPTPTTGWYSVTGKNILTNKEVE